MCGGGGGRGAEARGAEWVQHACVRWRPHPPTHLRARRRRCRLQVAALAGRMLDWVGEGGTVFFRESCFRQSGDKARAENPTHYR